MICTKTGTWELCIFRPSSWIIQSSYKKCERRYILLTVENSDVHQILGLSKGNTPLLIRHLQTHLKQNCGRLLFNLNSLLFSLEWNFGCRICGIFFLKKPLIKWKTQQVLSLNLKSMRTALLKLEKTYVQKWVLFFV